jgi:hypothetical protein
MMTWSSTKGRKQTFAQRNEVAVGGEDEVAVKVGKREKSKIKKDVREAIMIGGAGLSNNAICEDRGRFDAFGA